MLSVLVRHQGHIRFAYALLDDRYTLFTVPVFALASLKTIINRFLYARCPLGVRVPSAYLQVKK